MNTQELMQNAPSDYPKCTQADCPAAEQCLRHLMAQVTPEKAIAITVINPKNLKPELGTSCPYFHSSQPVRMARGFTRALGSVRHGEVNKVMEEISHRWSKATYYRLRKGERLISPQEQKIIADILVQHGAKEPIEFDNYEDGFDWFIP